MSQTPVTYRIYRFDAARMDVSADWIEAASTEEAIRLAETMGTGSKCEIWSGRELIATLGAEPLRQAAKRPAEFGRPAGRAAPRSGAARLER